MAEVALINGKELLITDETIKKTNMWYADNAQDCIDEAIRGEVRVNNLKGYIDWRKKQILKYLSADDTITSIAFLQMAVFIETGETVSILPKPITTNNG